MVPKMLHPGVGMLPEMLHCPLACSILLGTGVGAGCSQPRCARGRANLGLFLPRDSAVLTRVMLRCPNPPLNHPQWAPSAPPALYCSSAASLPSLLPVPFPSPLLSPQTPQTPQSPHPHRAACSGHSLGQPPRPPPSHRLPLQLRHHGKGVVAGMVPCIFSFYS